MTYSLASVLALGLDGFIVCSCLGTLRLGWTRNCLLATMCGITDAVLWSRLVKPLGAPTRCRKGHLWAGGLRRGCRRPSGGALS